MANSNTVASKYPVYTDGLVLIVPVGGAPCRELRIQDDITPRELIGITKFLTFAQSTCVVNATIRVNWSGMAKNLGIDRHFVQGQDVLLYDMFSNVLHLLLVDTP